MIIKIVRAENLPASDVNGTSDPFVRVVYDGKEIAATPKVKRDLNPRWDATVSLQLTPSSPLYVTLEVWDRDELSANDLLGALRLPFPDWRPHLVHDTANNPQRQQQPPLFERQRSNLHTNASSAAFAAAEAQRRSRSLHSDSNSNSNSGLQHVDSDTSLAAAAASSSHRLSSSSLASTATAASDRASLVSSTSAIKPVLIWSKLIKGTKAQGRLLCSIEFEQRDLLFLASKPYGTPIQRVFLPQNPRFAHEYTHLPRSWHPDFAIRQNELAALAAGTPRDCLFPWHETVLYMLEEVTVTFHVNESNQGVLATLLLTNYRLWFVPYVRVKGLIHEDVHTIPISKILRATIAQQKRSNIHNLNVLILENMDAGQYHVTLSPIARLREFGRDDLAKDAEFKRLKHLQNIVAEIEWLQLENSFCATTDLNHTIADAEEEKVEDDLRYYTPRPGGAARPPVLARALTEQFSSVNQTLKSQLIATTNVKASGFSGLGGSSGARRNGTSRPATHPPVTAPAQVSQTHLRHQQSAAPALGGASNTTNPTTVHHGKRRIQYNAEAEYRRQGVLHHPRWRICTLNSHYDMCATYPSVLVVPSSLSDDTILEASRFRSKNRFPALSWIHPRTGAPLCRSSQPNTGVLRSTNQYDRALIWAIRDACIPADVAWKSTRALPKKSSVLHIVDARPEINAKSNAFAGKGHESVKQYDRDNVAMASITFMGIDNIHVVRNSFASLTQALYEVEDANFFNAVQKSRWLEHICTILTGASEVANHLERGDAVLVHCSDGWDRTAQLSALAQIMLDPYFRTLEGFAMVIEKDWCAFGHMFEKRCGHPTSDQTSPVFPQFLDAVYQLTLQFPTHFQFNELFLSTIADAVYSSWHGTFQQNSEKLRRTFLATVATVSVWDVIRASTDQYLNPLFIGAETCTPTNRMEPMLPVCRVRLMQLWVSQYQKAISHMRLQQREFEMLALIRQQETELSRLYAVLTDNQQLELRAFQLRSDIAALARSMNVEVPLLLSEDEEELEQTMRSSLHDRSDSKNRDKRPKRPPATVAGSAGTKQKRSAAASVDLHDLSNVVATAWDQRTTRPTTATTSTTDRNVWNAAASSGASSAASTPPPSSAALVSSSGNNVPNARRRKSITNRTRTSSNSTKLKQSIWSMMGQMTTTHAATSDNQQRASDDNNRGVVAIDTASPSAATAAAAPATMSSSSVGTPRPQRHTVAHASTSSAASSSDQQRQNNSKSKSSDALRRDVHRLEDQLARMNHEVALKEESAKVLLHAFRRFNYNLPDSVAVVGGGVGFDDDSASPTRNTTTTIPTTTTHKSSRHHTNTNNNTTTNGSNSQLAETSESPSPDHKSPSSFSSPDAAGFNTTAQQRHAASSSTDDLLALHSPLHTLDSRNIVAPGSSPLLTSTHVVSTSTSGFRTNAQPVWERDGDAPCCKRCKKKFKTFYRPRHHCRCCGYVFCGKCTSNRMNLPEFGYYDVVRVCTVCYNSGEDG